MSEYQYYEFQAIDEPLDQKAMAELRAMSSRARITPTSFVNTYNWGNFRGDPYHLMTNTTAPFWLKNVVQHGR